MSLQSFLVFYIFKGDSYYANQKISNFIESIEKDSIIWHSLQKFHQKSTTVELNDIPNLESLIIDIFVKKIIP
jgi:hypothetical protein